MNLSTAKLYYICIGSSLGRKRRIKVLADNEDEAVIGADIKKNEKVYKIRKIRGLERFIEGIFLKKPREIEIVSIFDKVARLLKVNFSIEKAFLMQLSALKDIESKYILLKIVQGFRQGEGLKSAFEKYPQVFSPSLLAMLENAEKSNDVESVLEKISKTYKNRKTFAQKLTTQLIYPGIIVIVGTIVLLGFTFFFIPQLKGIYSNFGADLPPMTEGLYIVTQQIKRIPVLLLVPFLALILGYRKRASIFQSSIFQNLLYKVPMLGEFLWKKDFKQVLEYLILLLSSGVSVKEAIPSVLGVTRSLRLKKTLGLISCRIEEGESLSSAFEEVSDQWNSDGDTITHVIKVGEETGELERFLDILNQDFTETVEYQLNNFNKVLGPLLTLGLAIIGTFVVLTILYPLAKLTTVFINSTGI